MPTPARPVTAVQKSPDIELEDTELESEQLTKKKKGKKALKTQLTDTTVQTGSSASGLQIPTGGN
tara:strand:- start:24762 stop:24956 length:195 start_codon:yes stop_codon:yes gene_type:complete